MTKRAFCFVTSLAVVLFTVLFLNGEASAQDALPAPGKCDVQTFPEARLEAGLLVLHPPEPMRPAGGKRLRSHTHDSHHLGDHWAGPPVPAFIPLTSGGARLDVLERVGKFHVALYRETYDALWSRADSSSWTNRKYDIRIFDCNGKSVARITPNDFFSRKDHLEVQDVRFDGKRTVYFNEACQTYSRQAGGRCSSLVAVDVITKKVKWRSWPKRSNNVFLLHGDYIIAGYGFTGEASSLHMIRRSDGRVVTSKSLRVNVFPGGNHDSLAVQSDGALRVGVYESDKDLLFRLTGFDSRTPTVKFAGNIDQPPWPQRRRNRTLPPAIDSRIKRRRGGLGFGRR
jgi:hypothetical protein